MRSYIALLRIAREQVALATSGELESAVALLDARQQLLDALPAPTAVDQVVVREILDLDRQLSGMIRERMLRIRDESLSVRNGQSAMHRYRPLRDPAGIRVNSCR